MRRFVPALLVCFLCAVSAHSQTQSFWTTATVPANTTGNDSSSVELGLRFSANVAGTVTGARIYCASNSSGTHAVHLWNSKGTSLASVTMPACSGWTAINFSSAVAITAGSTYTISYHTTEYPWNTNFFASPLTSGNLTAPANAGVYQYGSSSAFPSSTWEATNYWVDVLFTAGTTYTISGNFTGVSSAAFALSGSATATTTSSNGSYSFAGLANGGTYTVTPSSTGYTFSPTSQTVTISGANATVPMFTATAIPTFTISGTFTGASTATFALSGSATATTTSSNGSYSFAGLANGGTYTVTPSSTGYTFSPTSQTVTISGANATVPMFTATAIPTFTISGTFTGVSSATFTLSGGATATITSSNGSYSFAGLANGGTYAVTPSSTGYSFSPTSQSVTINGANATVPVFTAMAVPTYGISGTVSPASIGSGAMVALSGPVGATTSVNSAGTYSFTGLPNGKYTVTPNSSTATFSPTVQNVTVANADATVPVFTATTSSSLLFYDDFTGTSLSSDWTIISRHGEYAQDETECNVPGMVSVANSLLTITTEAQAATCGDFNTNGTVRHTPSSWPYITGDVQWMSLNFTYGTVEIRAQFPSSQTSLWPATWMLGSNCQLTNIYTADTGYSTCPNIGSSGYIEMDLTECYKSGGWCQFHVANPSFGIGNGCDAKYSVDTNYHVFTTVWTSTSIKQYMDGSLITTCNQHIGNPMFLIIQTQTGGVGGTPSHLPATLNVDYVKVTQP